MTRGRIIAAALLAIGVLAGVWVARRTEWVETALPLPMRGEAATNPFYVAQHFVTALGANAERREIPRLDAREILTLEQDAARARPQHAADQVEQRRLAGSVRADHAADLAGCNREVDIGNGVQAAEALADLFH